MANKRKFLYFIKVGDKVKVGTSSDVNKRMKQIQTGNPDKVEKLAEFEGFAEKESGIHKELSDIHVRGEWFKFGDKIKWVIDTLTQRKHEFDNWDEITKDFLHKD
jgi:hypothetical protein